MRRMVFIAIVAALGAITTALPAGAQTTQGFRAEFHDNLVCPGFDLCGKGVVHGFGTATTTVVLTSVVPGADCLTATAERVVTLDSDGSTLLLSLAGTICDQKLAGTFVIASGTGVFAGASGGGTLWGVGTGVPVPSDSVHFRGTITLP